MCNLVSFPFTSFEHIAREYGSALALKDAAYQFTFSEVEQLSSALASCLQSHGVKKGDRVGVLVDRSAFLSLAILGLIKVGAVYVPIDPEAPQERITYMQTAAQLTLLIVSKRIHSDLIIQTQVPVIFLEQAFENKGESTPVTIEDEDPFVLFFTSGSTGKPKGVLLDYGGYRNNFQQMLSLLQMREKTRVAQIASASFDISLTELWMPLLVGAPIFFVPEIIKKNPWKLKDWILQHEIEVIQFVPSFFTHFLLALEGSKQHFPSVQKLLFIGEPLPWSSVSTWFENHSSSDCTIYNLYGPVEASIEVSAYLIQKETPVRTGIVPIGKPFEGVEFCILDSEGQEVDRGLLHIGGIQLARGYLNQEQTEKAFTSKKGSRIYNTGDVVEKLTDGNYQFICRQDRQVKIRGFRVELGEIEEAILAAPGIQRVAVILLRMEESSELIAFIQSSDAAGEDARQYVSRFLPSYMLPQRWVVLDSIPLNVNGKTDYPLLEKRARGESP